VLLKLVKAVSVCDHFLVPVFSLAVTIPTFSSFWQFQRMVKHITGRSAFFSYYGYGCYCGLGGKGIPVDDTDRWVQRLLAIYHLICIELQAWARGDLLGFLKVKQQKPVLVSIRKD
jgi:hypothetical protein